MRQRNDTSGKRVFTPSCDYVLSDGERRDEIGQTLKSNQDIKKVKGVECNTRENGGHIRIDLEKQKPAQTRNCQALFEKDKYTDKHVDR